MVIRSGLYPGKDSGTVASDEAPRVKPTLHVVGALAWARKNLFRSWFDTLLTLASIIVIGGVLSSLVTWMVGQANWFVIIFNLRLLILGRYPADAEWRVAVLAAIAAFALGVSLAAWARVTSTAALIIMLILVSLVVVPPFIAAFVPASPSYVAAGSNEIIFSAARETPQSQLGFIAKAGDTITVRLADQYVANDQTLRNLYGFSDRVTALLANAASGRLGTAARLGSLNAQLSSDLLTAGQRARITAQLTKLQVPAPITETYGLNRGAIKVRILRGTTLDPLLAGMLTAGSSALRVTLPADGWYILEKIPADRKDSGAALLEVQGIGPILERDLTSSGNLDKGGSASATGRVFQYIRVTDNFMTQEARPSSNGKNVPMATLIDNAYHGSHTLADFLRLFVGPFFDMLKVPFLVLAIAGALGYLVGLLLDHFVPYVEGPRRTSRRFATWLLIAFPVVMFGLVYGIGSVLPLTDTRRWGGLLLTIMLTLVCTLASFPIGVTLALGRRSGLPIVRIVSTLYIEFVRGVPLITVLFMAQLLLPLVNPTLAEMPNVFRAMVAITLFNAAYLAENVRGGLQAVPHGQEEAAKALGLNSLQIILYITLPQALRAILPALVGMVISLFIDTSLVTIVGLLDLTGMAQNVVTQTEFIGLRRETLVFITMVYFGISYIVAHVSRRIEKSGAGAVLSHTI